MNRPAVTSQFEPEHGKPRNHTAAFAVCVILTFASYFVAASQSISKDVSLAIIGLLAIIQCAVQLVVFLRLGHEFKPRWKLLTFVFMISIVIIVVFGSLWIMNNLNYRMTPEQMDHYMQSQDGL